MAGNKLKPFSFRGIQSRGIQCHGCEGYGHIRVECPTSLKKQEKGMSVTWSDGDSESDSEEESAKLVTAISGVCNSDNDSSDQELTFEELANSYKKLCIRSAEVCQQNEKQKKLLVKLEAEKKEDIATIIHLKGEVLVLNSKLDQMTKSVRMLTNETDKLEEILQIGQNAGNMSRIGFVGAKESTFDIKKPRPDKQMSKQMNIGFNIKDKET